MSEEKIDRIENRLTELITITGNLVVAFRGLNDNVNSLKASFDNLETRFDNLETRFDNLETRFDNLEARFDNLEARFDKFEKRLDNVEKRLDSLERKTDRTNAVLSEALVRIIDLQKVQNELVFRVERLEKTVGII